MVGRLRMRVAIAALAAIAMLGMTQHAHATFSITLSDGVTSQTINGAGNSISLANLSFAGYTFSAFSGSINNVPGSTTLGFIQVGGTLTAAGANPLTITAFADGYTSPLGDSVTLKDQLTVSGTGSGFTIESTGTGIGNGGPGTTVPTPTVSQSGITPQADPSFATFTTGSDANNNYSLQQTLKISGLTLSDGATLTFSGETDAFAPAPGGLTLAFAGLACCAPLVWLRRRKMALLAA